MSQDRFLKAQHAFDDIRSLVQKYGGKVPLSVANDVLARLNAATDLLKNPAAAGPGELLADNTVLEGKSRYFGNPEERTREIAAFSGGVGAESKEGAYTFATKLVTEIASFPRSKMSDLDNALSVLAAVILELLLQSGASTDFRILPSVQEEYAKAINEKRIFTWNALVSSDWARVCERYEKGEGFFFDFPEFKVYPMALTLEGEPHPKLGTKPYLRNWVSLSLMTLKKPKRFKNGKLR